MSTNVEQGKTQQNKQVWSEFQGALNRRAWSTSALSRFIRPDVIDHTAAPGDVQGVEGVHRRLASWYAAFGDATEVNLATVAEQDLVSVLYETRATHAGTFMGIPATGRRVTIPGIRFLRFEGGQIAEIWGIYDYFTTAMEIGANLTLLPGPSGVSAASRSQSARPSRPPIHVPTEADLSAMSSDRTAVNKAVLLRFREDVFNAHDWSTANLGRFLKPDIIDHNAFPGDAPGLEGVRSRFSMWQAAFDDADEEYQAVAGEEDRLAVLYDLHATHTGEYLGVQATNRRVTIPGIEFLRFENGMIAEHWGIYDFRATASETGATLAFTPRTTQLPPKPMHPHARFVPPSAIRQ